MTTKAAVFDAQSGKVRIQIKEEGDYEISLEFQNEKGQQISMVIKAKVEVFKKEATIDEK